MRRPQIAKACSGKECDVPYLHSMGCVSSKTKKWNLFNYGDSPFQAVGSWRRAKRKKKKRRAREKRGRLLHQAMFGVTFFS